MTEFSKAFKHTNGPADCCPLAQLQVQQPSYEKAMGKGTEAVHSKMIQSVVTTKKLDWNDSLLDFQPPYEVLLVADVVRYFKYQSKVYRVRGSDLLPMRNSVFLQAKSYVLLACPVQDRFRKANDRIEAIYDTSESILTYGGAFVWHCCRFTYQS